MVAVLSQPVARPAEGVIFLAHLLNIVIITVIIVIIAIIIVIVIIIIEIVIIMIVNLVIAELMTVGCVLLAPGVEDAAQQTVDENYIHLEIHYHNSNLH